MAKQKPLTRFYASLSGFKAELFSVRERTCGDLIVKHRPIFYERAPFSYHDQDQVEAEYYSVHVSPQSSGHVITHTKEMKIDGEKRSSWIVDCPAGRPFLTLLYSRRHTSLVEELFRCPLNMRDTRVEVAGFDVQKCQLVTHVLVGDRDGLKLADMDLPWDVVTHRFRRFEVHVVRAFIPFPAFDQGCHLEPPDRAQLLSLSDTEVLPLLDNLSRSLVTTFMGRAITLALNASPDLVAEMRVGDVVDSGPLMDKIAIINDARRLHRYPIR